MATAGMSLKDLERDFRGILAARLFELRRVTLAQASAMAGLNIWEFLEYLGRQGTSVINMTPDELAEDVR